MKRGTKRFPSEEIVTVNTDASCDHKGSGGFGIWIKSNFFTIRKAGKFIGNISDSNEAEIKALVNALHILNQNTRKFKVLVINCDNAVVRSIVKTGKIAKRFKVEGEMLLEELKPYDIVISKYIKGHKADYNARQFVNNWCDKASKAYRKKSYKE
jgi:ribonuclease HI